MAENRPRPNRHTVRENHPAMCSPYAVTVHGQDCLMDPACTFVFWTGNMDPNRVLIALEHAAERVRAFKAQREVTDQASAGG